MRSAILHGAVLLLTAALCQGAPEPRPALKEQVQLAVWHDGEEDVLKTVGAVARHAQAQNPGLIVTVRSLPTAQARAQLDRWTASDSVGFPDVVIVPGHWLPIYAHGLKPLNALLSAQTLRAYPASVRERLRYSETLFGIPWTGETQALFYRADLFRAAGVLPPRTWDELVIAARRCHAPPTVYGFGLPGTHDDAGARTLLQLLHAAGADLPPIEAPSALGTPQLQAALSRYAELHTVAEPEVLAWDAESLQAFFVDGRLAMLIAPKSFEGYIGRHNSGLEWATAPLPADRIAAGEISVDVACILKSTRHLEASVKLLKALATRESAELRLRLGGVPLEESLAQDRRLDPAYAAYIAGLQSARGVPVERWPAVQPILSDALFYLLTGRMDATEAAEMVRNRLTSGDAARFPG